MIGENGKESESEEIEKEESIEQLGSNNFNLDLPEPVLENLATINSIIKITSESNEFEKYKLASFLLEVSIYFDLTNTFIVIYSQLFISLLLLLWPLS